MAETAAFPAREAEQLLEALEREWYRAGAGLTPRPALEAIHARFPRPSAPEVLPAARDEFLASGDRRARVRLEWLTDLAVARATAELEARQVEWEYEAVVVLPNGDRHYYQRAFIDLARLRDRGHRLELERARSALAIAALSGLRGGMIRREREVLASLGLGDPVAARGALSGVALDELARSCADLLAATTDLYREALERLSRQRLGLPAGELEKADVAWLFASSRIDRVFDGDTLLSLARLQLGEMRLEASAEGRIRFDTADRPGKRPRAFCAPVRVPDEIYLVLRPRGGHVDLRSFWHELGHAVHYANVDSALPIEARRLGDQAVTEAYAVLFDHLTVDVGWLRRYLGLSAREAQAVVRELAVGELFIRRRYAAKLLYELELYRADDPSSVRGRYEELMTAATLIPYPDAEGVLDVDPGLYSARYLRGWQLEGALGHWMTENFGDDWYRNPEAGPALRELLRRGSEPPADELARELTGRPPDFAPLVRRAEAWLG